MVLLVHLMWGAIVDCGFIFTARKRSLGQGNIFIGVCQEFCSRGGGGVCSRGGAWWRFPPDGYCCGRYASYWNAFLYCKYDALSVKVFSHVMFACLRLRFSLIFAVSLMKMQTVSVNTITCCQEPILEV